MKFILSRTNDYETRSKKWILGYGLLFWLISRIFAVILLLACTAIYNSLGINPESLTSFGGDPANVKSVFSFGYGFMVILLIAPVLEECIFRLGLSLKKLHISIAAAAIPAYMLFQGMGKIPLPKVLILAGAAFLAFCMVYFLTSQKFWDRQKHRYFKYTVWLTSIAFGLIHLIAFSNHILTLLPYMLCVITVPFLAGCAITYYRLNLGFWWGVGLHIFNNLPGIIMMSAL